MVFFSKYHHDDIAVFLGYNRCVEYQSARSLIELMRKVLKEQVHYMDTDNGKKGVKRHYWINRVEFYMIRVTSNKPKAMCLQTALL